MALNLSPDETLGQHHARSFFELSYLHYPTASLTTDRLVRCPAHSDFGTLTLLFQDAVGGLEIADTSSTNSEISAEVERSGKFIHVDPKPGTILVNVGYLLMRWSNGRWRNTIHRVSEPPHLRGNGSHGAKGYETAEGNDDGVVVIPERYSIAYFSDPDPETVIEALPACCGDHVPSRWKPMNAGEYLRKKKRETYA